MGILAYPPEALLRDNVAAIKSQLWRDRLKH